MADSELLALQQPTNAPDIDGTSTVTDALLPGSSTAFRMRHFPSEVWDTSAESHLTRFVKALIGDTGAGQLRKRLLAARLRETLQGTHFFDLDRFYGPLFGLRRSVAERLSIDPYSTPATTEEWDEIHSQDASYRSRIEQFARAISYGATPVGIELAAEAVLNVDCEVYENYLLADTTYQTWGEFAVAYPTWGDVRAAGLRWRDARSPSDGSLAIGINRREFVVRPRRQITQAERHDLMRVLDRIKPVDALVRIEVDGLGVNNLVDIRSAEADSEHWEVIQKVVAQGAGTEQPYLVESTVPEEQPRSPFTGYQGEAWSYNAEISAIQGYLETLPDEPVLVGGQPGLLHERVLVDGQETDFLPRLSLMPKRYVLAGRYVSDGVLSSDPYPNTRTTAGTGVYGDFYVDEQGRVFRSAERPVATPVSGVTADRVPLDQLARAVLGQEDADSAVKPELRYWSTPPREQGDAIREVLEFRYVTPKPLNYLSFEAAHYPHSIMVQAWDEQAGAWQIVLRHTITDSYPSKPSQTPHPVGEHPMHFGADHWVKIGGRLDSSVTTKRLRIVLQRTAGTPPYARISQSYAYAIPQKTVNYEWRPETYGANPSYESQVLATHQQTIASGQLASDIGQNLPPAPVSSPGGWFISSIVDSAPRYYSGTYYADAPMPYGLAVRNLDAGFRVSSRSDLPLLPTEQPVGVSQDMLGNKVEFHVRELKASNLLRDTSEIWKSEPQPISSAVVNLYLDLRDTEGDPQVIDRLFLEPTHPGPKLNLYWSNQDPDGNFQGSSRVLPYGAWTSFGTLVPESNGVRFTDSDVSYIDLDNGVLCWDASRSWWVGMQLTAEFFDTTDRRVLLDMQGIQVWVKSQKIVFNLPSGERAEADANFNKGQTVTFVAVHEPGQISIHLKVGSVVTSATTAYTTPILRSSSPLRIGGPLASVSLPPAMLMRSMVLKQESATEEIVTAFLDGATDYPLPTENHLNALVRMHPSYITETSPYGLLGGPGYAHEDIEWTPVRRDYVLQKGFLYIPPTKAKYWKLEFTKLVPEPYETFLPLSREVKIFPQGVTLRQIQREMGGAIVAQEPGSQTAQDLASRIFYVDSLTALTPALAETERLSTEVLVPTDPTASARLREQSFIYGFHDWHQGYVAPQFSGVEKHRYERVEIRHDQRVGYVVGLKSLKAYRVDYLQSEDTPVYVDRFDDLTFIESYDWEYRNGAFFVGDIEEGEQTVTSNVLRSSSDVRAIQFATQQSQPRQLVLDPDFRDGKLIDYTWDNLAYWHVEGSATARYDATTYSVYMAREVIVGGVTIYPTHGLPRPIVHEIGSSEAITMPDTGGADASLGGLSSELVNVSDVGQVWAAARFTALTELETPLMLQIVTEDGLVVAEERYTPEVGQVNEVYINYVVGSLAAANRQLRVRLVQVGNTVDAWQVESIALFDEGILWEFSVNGGEDWTPAYSIRNNMYGVLTFERPGNALRWRARGGRAGVHITSIKIRPWYKDSFSSRSARPSHGLNVSLFDHEPPIEQDPEFRAWQHPIPRSWFKAYQRIPTIRALALFVPDGGGPVPTDTDVLASTVATASVVGTIVFNIPATPTPLAVAGRFSVPAPTIVVVNNTSQTTVLATVATTAAVSVPTLNIPGTPTPLVVNTAVTIPAVTITAVTDTVSIARTTEDNVSGVTDEAARRITMFRSGEE